jgi:hypothetical protein
MAKIFRLLVLFFFCGGIAFAQTTQVTGTITDAQGIPYAGAQMTVGLTFAGTPVSNPTVTINVLAQCRANGFGSAPCQVPFSPTNGPFTLDPTGSIPGGGITLQDNTQVTPSGAKWTFSISLAPGILPPFGTGPQTCSGTLTISGGSQSITGAITCPLLSRPVTAGAGGSPGQSQVNNGGALAGTPCETYPNLSTGPVSVNCDWESKGPNPYVDIRSFGARSVNPLTTPAAVGLTANCTSTQNQVTISAPSTFVNSDGVIVYGCGAPQSMTTPGTPTVTPSLSLAGTGTLINTPGPTGATTFNYKAIARDRNGGTTAASATGSTTTGAAALGAVTVNITSMSRSGQPVTVTTATAHGFLVGCTVSTCGEVFIGGGNALSDFSFRGWFSVASAADTTHFTFIGPPSTALGASTSATGGTATFFSSNLVCVPSAVTGAVDYAFYSDRAVSGTFALIAQSNPNSASGTQDLCIEDFGSPMMDNQLFPAIFPASFAGASPPAATSDSLSTTISSGAGSTTLTLANPAGTTASGQTIRLDAAPAIAAAAASISSLYGTLYIPTAATLNTSFVVNSWLQLDGGLYAIGQSGSLYLNDTVEVINSSQRGATWLGVFPQHGNSVSSSAFSSGPTVTINSAHPGLFFSGGQNGLHGGHFSVQGAPVNGTLAFLVEGGFNQTFDWIDCASGSGANDYMSSCYQFRPNPGQGNSNVTLDYVGLSPGGVGDGVSHTPTVFFRNPDGNVAIPHSYSVHRGMLYAGTSSIQLGVGGITYINGGGTPLLTTYSSTGVVNFGHTQMDTIAMPCVAALTNGAGLVAIQFVYGNCVPSSGVNLVSGNYGSLTASSGTGSLTTFANTSSVITTNIGGGTIVLQNYQNGYGITGPSFSSFVNNTPMAAPTCSVSAGGSLAVNSYQFFIVPIWQNGFEGQPSPFSGICTTSSGNQTITVNWATAAGNPKNYDLYYCIVSNGCSLQAGQAASNGFANPQPPTATSLVWTTNTFNTSVNSGLSRGGPTMMMDGTKGIAVPKKVTGNCTSSASPATCVDFIDGAVAIPAGTTTLTVNTTAVTANSDIHVFRNDALGTRLGVTCNTATVMGEIKVSTITPGTSFQITVQTAPATNPGCLTYEIEN